MSGFVPPATDFFEPLARGAASPGRATPVKQLAAAEAYWSWFQLADAGGCLRLRTRRAVSGSSSPLWLAAGGS